MLQFIKSLFTKPTLYPLENRTFRDFDVIFSNATVVPIKNTYKESSNNMIRHVMGTYETVINESNILTMTVRSRPIIDTTICFDDNMKCIRISSRINSFVQDGGRAHKVYNETIGMIDTTKYKYFSITE